MQVLSRKEMQNQKKKSRVQTEGISRYEIFKIKALNNIKLSLKLDKRPHKGFHRFSILVSLL